jgi:hypothetical protein
MGTAESRTSLELKHKMKSSKEGDNCMSLSQYAIYQNAMARAEISRLAAAQLHLASPGHGDVESFAGAMLRFGCAESPIREYDGALHKELEGSGPEDVEVRSYNSYNNL